MQFEVHAMTHPGQMRKTNQDAILVDNVIASKTFYRAISVTSPENGVLLAVADGVSGAPCPSTASRRALELLLELHAETHLLTPHLLRAVQQRLSDEVAAKRCFGMATCIAALHLTPKRATVVHAGDCRVYLQRDGSLRQLTEDHTIFAGMVSRGEVLPGERGQYASIYSGLESAIVADPLEADFEIGWISLTPKPGDCWLLCSDGVHEVFASPTLEPGTVNELLGLRDYEERFHAMDLLNAVAYDLSSDNLSLILAYVD